MGAGFEDAGVGGYPVDDGGDEAGMMVLIQRQVRPDRDGGPFVPFVDDLEEQLAPRRSSLLIWYQRRYLVSKTPAASVRVVALRLRTRCVLTG